jgi:IMP dehydrogenase/GMP reductase
MARPPTRIGLSFDDVLLVPQRSRAAHRRDVDTAVLLTPRIRLQVPLISANTPWCTEAALAIAMARAGGMGVVHRMCTIDHERDQVALVKRAAAPPAMFPDASVDARGRLIVGAAVGVRGDWQDRAGTLVEAGVDLLVVDIAHGHADHACDAVQYLKSVYPATPVVAGNVATRGAVRDLASAGADVVKIGIGPGAVCTTRRVTGAGVPQLTAVLDCAGEGAELGVAAIADGGVRSSGDIVKALAAGASAVMVGALLAGVEESAAILVEHEGAQFKVTTGFATLGAAITLKRARNEPIARAELERYVPEGVEATFPFAGNARSTIAELAGGMRSGLSYCGAMSIAELWERAEFIQVTAAGRQEGEPHALARSRQLAPDYRAALRVQ